MSLYSLLIHTWDTKYVTVSNTWTRKDTVTSYFTMYTLCTETKLTVRRGQNIHSFGKLLRPRLDYWYHICTRLDLKGNEIEVAVNGRLLGRVAELGSLSSGHGHGNFRQAHIYNFRDKCVAFVRNHKFANLTQ